ncbi:MAG: ADOP family duplicated permease [bacterium]
MKRARTRLVERFHLWLRALLFRTRVETEMDKEIRIHLEMETDNNIQRGMSPTEAKRAALLAFGGVEQTKEAVRDERQTLWLDQFVSDLKFAVRGFRRQPAFAAAVVTLIALGVGANAAMFSVVHHLLLAPLPYADGDRMVRVTSTAGGGRLLTSMTTASVDRWRARIRTIESITVIDNRRFELGDTARGPTERIEGVEIAPGTMAFVGMRPLVGRDIEAADTLRDAVPVALLSYSLWQRVFGARIDAIGRTIVVNNVPHTVIGVMPREFSVPFSDGAQVFPSFRGGSPDRSVDVIAKLRRGVTVETANREFAAIFTNLDKNRSEDAPRVERAIDQVPADVKRTVYLMFGAVGIVLLIACANVANLLATRAWSRQREFAIRAAMGAGRARLVRQVFVESFTLALIGGATSIAVAAGTLQLLSAQSQINRYTAGSRLEPAVLLWLVGVSVGTGFLFGLAPAIFVSADRATEALKAGNRSVAGSPSARRLRGGLVIGEVALSVVLLVASGLLIRTIVAMQHADVGFQSHGLSGVQISLTDKSLSDSAARHAILEDMLARVRSIPGIRQATLAVKIPPEFVIGTGQLEIEGRAVLASDSLSVLNLTIGRPDLFSVAGVRIIEGRVFDSYDVLTDRSGEAELVVNESFAHRFWPDGGAIGAKLRRGNGSWTNIVGIANDITVPGADRLSNAVQFYQAIGASPFRATVAFRSDLPPAAVLPAVTLAIRAASARIKIGSTVRPDDRIAAWRIEHTFTLRLIGAFAVLALLLAAFGLHATIAYSVAQRTREIGIRIALGAEAEDVMSLVIGQGIKLSVAGIVVGAVAGVLAARTMRALLYHVAPSDPATLIAVSAVLVGVAVVASYSPARRAIAVDPVEALRSE